MDLEQTVASLWRDVDRQNWGGLAAYFSPSAVIRWHNTNEQFTVDEFVRANSEYPGDWAIRVERVLAAGDTVVSAVAVSAREGDASFHAASFFRFENGKIVELDEYWGDDAPPPQWRVELGIGGPMAL